jgi:hypothetical protein
MRCLFPMSPNARDIGHPHLRLLSRLRIGCFFPLGFFCCILRAGLRVESVGWVFVKEAARDVGPELIEDGANPSFGGLDQPIGEGLSDPLVAGGVIEIGDCSGDNVAPHVGVVRFPFVGVVVPADDAGGE